MLTLYNRERSGNCYKVRLMAALLGVAYEKVTIGRQGKGRNELPPDFERMSPLRQVPVLLVDGTPIWGTISIMTYLCRGHDPAGRWLPHEAMALAQVTQWLQLAQNELFYGFGVARSARGGRWHGRGTLEEAQGLAVKVAQVLESRLATHPWLALEHASLADIACYSYTCFAGEGGVSLKPFPALRDWLARIAALPGYLAPPQYDGAGGTLVE